MNINAQSCQGVWNSLLATVTNAERILYKEHLKLSYNINKDTKIADRD